MKHITHRTLMTTSESLLVMEQFREAQISADTIYTTQVLAEGAQVVIFMVLIFYVLCPVSNM